MKKSLIIILAAVLLAILGIYVYRHRAEKDSGEITVTVKKGTFEVIVTTTGELQAKNSEDVRGPSTLQAAGIWNVKISDIVPEGSVVKAGEYVATLDRAEASSKSKDLENEVQKIESQFTQTQLDTTLQLRTARDELINLNYAKEERRIVVTQSKYEPPAVLRQAEIDLEKAERAYDQAKENYKLKTKQLTAKMAEVSASLNIQKNKLALITSLLSQFEIRAPKGGMVIYVRQWNGKKKGVGATISPWDPAVATLPDLSTMITQSYVNEVDISKIKIGQSVKVGVDAFPEKLFDGKVIAVANVGEQRPNTDAKVFEVKILLTQTDPVLRPAMTTSNTIQASSMKNVLHVPVECIHGNDTSSYVFSKKGFKIHKVEVKTGASNANEIVVLQGLSEGDELLLSTPEDAEAISLEKLPKNKAKAMAQR